MAAQTKYDASTDTIKGSFVGLFLNGKPLAFCIDESLDINADEDDITNKMTGGGDWKAGAIGELSWGYNANMHLSTNKEHNSFDTLFDLMVKKQPVDVKMGYIKKSGEDYQLDTEKVHYEGKANITKLSRKDPAKERSTVDVSFNGVGPLTKGGSVA